MAAFFDIQTIRNIIAFPFRLFFSREAAEFDSCRPVHRTRLTSSWRRNSEGRLERHWEVQN